MKYGRHNVFEKTWGVEVTNVTDFDLKHIFECGQCFRWNEEADGSYTGVVKGKVANISYNDETLKLENVTVDDFRSIWFDYLDLGRDYSAIKDAISKDSIMKEAIKFGYGIRLLKQEFWETVISFIISANNRIPRIKQIIEKICLQYGEAICLGENKYYAFPTPEILAKTKEDELSLCKAGYRCKYIINSAKLWGTDSIDIKMLQEQDIGWAREQLKTLPGVGDKVADCSLLYSGTRYDVFPTDVWVKRVIGELYLGNNATLPEIQTFAKEYFGRFAGFAQQYLFYFARENKIGI